MELWKLCFYFDACGPTRSTKGPGVRPNSAHPLFDDTRRFASLLCYWELFILFDPLNCPTAAQNAPVSAQVEIIFSGFGFRRPNMAADANPAKNAFFQSFVPPRRRSAEHCAPLNTPRKIPKAEQFRPTERTGKGMWVQPRRSTDIAEDGTGSGFTEAGAPPRFRCRPMSRRRAAPKGSCAGRTRRSRPGPP